MKARGFSLVELLVSIGVICTLLALLLPSLSGTRGLARGVTGLSRQKQIATGVVLYAANAKDLPPVLYEPRWPRGNPMPLDVGSAGSGFWFDHAYLYGLEILAQLESPAVGIAPGNKSPHREVQFRGRLTRIADYWITNTLYATPSFFSWETQTGVEQFRPQQLSSVSFPASKGMMWAPYTFSHPGASAVLSCCGFDVESPITFFDMSGGMHSMKAMKPGILNLFESVVIPPDVDPRSIPGTPVANTPLGVHGLDR
jgi:prepilin-type N-terminal cleavage/methylation domain-containing protein